MSGYGEMFRVEPGSVIDLGIRSVFWIDGWLFLF